MNNNYEDCSWEDTYRAMGCELPYGEDNEEDSEPDEIDDYNELTQAVDEIRIPLNPPRPAPESPYIPEAIEIDIYEPSFALFGR